LNGRSEMFQRFSIVNFTVFSAFSAISAWALTGTLTDNNNKALSDAVVWLVNANQKDTTDANGYFNFVTNAAKGVSSPIPYIAPTLAGNAIRFSLKSSSRVEYAIYSINGAIISQYRTSLEKGIHTLALNKNLATGIYFIQFKAGDQVASFRYTNLYKRYSNASFASKTISGSQGKTGLNKAIVAGAPATISRSAIDTLVVTKVVEDVTSMRKLYIYDYGDNINSSSYTSNGMQIVILDPSNDNDGDGLTNFEERYIYHTNAELFDTDGDGMGDNAEIKDNTDPLIANYPSVSFVAKNSPTIVAFFTKTFDEQSGREISSGGDYSNSSTFSTQQQVNANASVAVMVGGEISKDPKITGSITATVGAGWSMTWGTEQSTSVSQNWNNAVSYGQSHGLSIQGGRIKIDIDLINNSSVNVTLVNPMIRLSSNDIRASTLSTQIGELTLFTGDGISGDNEVTIPFEPGNNHFERQFGVNSLNPDLIESLAKNSCGLKAQLTNIRFKTSLGEIDTLMANIYRRTAEVIVDFGQALTPPNNLIKKRVSSRAVYNDFYTNQTDRYISTTLFDLLKAAGVTPVIGTDSGKTGITEINGVKNGTLKNGIWSIVCQITPDSLQIYSTKMASYDPKAIRVGQTSIISCIYDSDIDGDGLPSRVEAMLGTDDTKVDSDGDGISDKDEFMGWRRASDSAGVLWHTNPRSKDTDFDSLNDFVDPDPLTPAKNPLDSVVSFSALKLTPFQGTEWVNTAAINDSLTTLPVNRTVRGSSTVSMKFSHPINMAMVIYRNSKDVLDTTKLFNPDTGGTYSKKINLPLGNNEVKVVAISKDASTTKKVVLTGIDRRLVRIDQSNTTLFQVTKPAPEKNGIGANVFVDVDKIKGMDSLIQRVMVLRTDIDMYPLVAADKTKKMTAQNLGDTGDGVANIHKGGTVRGIAADYNVYRVVDSLVSGNAIKLNTDSTIVHRNDLCYFAYTSAIVDSKVYMAAPVGDIGTCFTNDRLIIVDSVGLFTIVRQPWGLGTWVTAWQFIQRTTMHIGNDSTTVSEPLWEPNILGVPLTGVPQESRLRPAHELDYNDSIRFNGKAGATWARNDANTWRDDGSLPAYVSFIKIVDPQLNSISGWTYSSLKVNKAEAFTPPLPDLLIYNFKAYDGLGIYLFDHGFKVYWRYKDNPTSN
jgi:hypothetical protein